MFKQLFDSLSSSFVAHAAEVTDAPNDTTPPQEEEHFLQKMKNEKQCGVCAPPETLSGLKSLVAQSKSEPGKPYGLPKKRKVLRPVPYKQIRFLYTSREVLPNGYHMGNFTDRTTFGAARRWIVNRLLAAPKAEVSHLVRYSAAELEKMREYWANPEQEEYEVDYHIPSDPEEREQELGTATENNVKILLHSDGSISPLHCPTTYQQLSQGTWTYLHTMAAYYPEDPTPELQAQTKAFFDTFALLYPCHHCKDHMVKYLVKKPVDVSNNAALSIWTCEYHNEINQWLGKRTINCDAGYLLDRYKNGYGGALGVTCESDNL